MIDNVFTGFETAHAATIINRNNTIMLCWHGRKLSRDQLAIWFSYYDKESQLWSEPKKITSSLNHSQNCMNPVLFQEKNKEVLLYFKEGTYPPHWKGWQMNFDSTKNQWSKPVSLENGFLGPTRSPPVSTGDWVLSLGSQETTTERYVVFERYNYRTTEQQLISLKPEKSLKENISAIQPALVVRPDQSILALCRTIMGYIYQTSSYDHGLNWAPFEKTDMENPDSAICTLTVENGYYVMMNPDSSNRSNLWIIFFPWAGKKVVLHKINHENKDIAYPSLILLKNGHLLAAYSINQRVIKVVEINRI